MKYLLVLLIIINFLNAEIKKTYYPNGKIESEISMQDSKKEGMERYYYKNGVLKWEISWKNDKRNGIEKEYYNIIQMVN
jgi:antitoxin component YwqK of YwqJK toxin-antitoxin module